MVGWLRHPRLRLALLLGVITACILHAQAAPDVNKLAKPSGYVSDFAHVLSADDSARLAEYCTRIQQQLGVQLAIVTIETLGDTPIEDFSLNLGRKWGVGAKGDNSGVLMLVVIKDHKNRVEVGRGVEQYVTDGFAGSVLRSMRPDLRAANYGAALLEGSREIADEIAKGKGIAFNETPGLPPRQIQNDEPRDEPRWSGLPIGQIIIGIVVVLFILRMLSRGGGGRGGGGGFWTGFLLSTLFNSGGGRGGGSWGGGGFGGGSSGGGGFGGFGGGDFGGGGASSDW